jgi:hypothetical protein
MNVESFFLLLACQTLSIIIAIFTLTKLDEWINRHNRNKRK